MMHPRRPTTMALHRNNLGRVTRYRSRLCVLLGLARRSLAPGKLLFNACKLQTVPPLGTNGTTAALLVSLCPPWRAWRPCSNPKHFTTTVDPDRPACGDSVVMVVTGAKWRGLLCLCSNANCLFVRIFALLGHVFCTGSSLAGSQVDCVCVCVCLEGSGLKTCTRVPEDTEFW